MSSLLQVILKVFERCRCIKFYVLVDFNSAMSEGEETGISNCEDTVSATVDIRKFLMFLSGMQLTNYNTTCSIVNHKLVRLSLEQPGALSLQCYFSQICT